MPVIKTIKGKTTISDTEEKLKDHTLTRLTPAFEKLNLTTFPKKILLLGLKEERVLQVYVKIESRYFFLKEYPFTAMSGVLGPKLKQGDRQIPEGVYDIEYLNPNSSFHLSMKVSYPNKLDKEKSTFKRVTQMGGDIFIHGKDATIGCIPIGDQAIEEVFLMATHALENKIEVIISPRDFRLNKEYPTIDFIDWETELYEGIHERLTELPLPFILNKSI